MDDTIFIVCRYRQLLNEVLPGSFTKPVRFNHCFNRIVLDWLFQDVWYNHLDATKNAISQLTNEQLKKMIARMEQWLLQLALLFADNQQSLKWRKKQFLLTTPIKTNQPFLELKP